MNTTIVEVNNNTMNLKVRELTKKLIANSGKLFKATFTKGDGSVREMIFSIATNWNNLCGITTTEQGKKMISTKCKKNILSVCEKIGEGMFQPRSISLEKVISLDVL